MAETINIYDPRTMQKLISRMPPVHTFLKSKFFKNFIPPLSILKALMLISRKATANLPPLCIDALAERPYPIRATLLQPTHRLILHPIR